jgi:hypothetical protein
MRASSVAALTTGFLTRDVKRTLIMGATDMTVNMPKPSGAPTAFEKPMPMASTKGTVTGPVVTPGVVTRRPRGSEVVVSATSSPAADVCAGLQLPGQVRRSGASLGLAAAAQGRPRWGPASPLTCAVPSNGGDRLPRDDCEAARRCIFDEDKVDEGQLEQDLARA